MYNTIWYDLQESGILLGGSLTEKNQWGLLTGDDGVGFSRLLTVVLHSPTSPGSSRICHILFHSQTFQ